MPCFNHALNLSLAKSSIVQDIHNAVGIVKEVVSFFNTSAKKNFISKCVLRGQMLSVCETRWIERHEAILQFCERFHRIVRALRIVSTWQDTETSSKACTLLRGICCCQFIMSLFSLSDVLSVTAPLSRMFQTVNFDIYTAKTKITDVVAVLDKRRSDFEHFDETVFASACRTMKRVGVQVEMPRVKSSNRQEYRSNPPGDTPTQFFRRAIYLPLLDSVLTDLRCRFGDDAFDKLSCLSFFIPACVVDSSCPDSVTKLVTEYGLLDSAHIFKLRAEIDLWRQQWIRRKAETPYMTVPQSAADALVSCDEQCFPIVSALLTILLTLPSSTASAERSFSTLRRLKTWIRSRMGEDRLTALALLNIHRDIEIDTDSVVDMFAKTK